MLKSILAAAAAAALLAAPLSLAAAQTRTEQSKPEATKSEPAKPANRAAGQRAAKPLTPQQQKMKDCGPKWQAYKKAHNVKGKVEYQKFLKTCLKS